MKHCNQFDNFSPINKQLQSNERKTFWVVILTAITMVVEIIAGYLTGSMALLADGWHMASHAAALTLTLIIYRLARSTKVADQLTFGTGKLMPLGGYTSAIGLGAIALFMIWESFERFINPIGISFNEALIVAVVGLIVNIVSALLLANHHEHDHTHDHNHEAAYIHVIADAVTSIAAILALVIGKYFNQIWLDPVIGVVGAILILRWAYKLLKETAWELLDGHAKRIDFVKLKNELEVQNSQVLDLHVWRIGPKGLAVQLIVENGQALGVEFYKDVIWRRLPNAHIVVEERLTKAQ